MSMRPNICSSEFILLNWRFTNRMMPVPIADLSEPFIAEIAGKWTLFCMSEHMISCVAHFVKLFGADNALQHLFFPTCQIVHWCRTNEIRFLLGLLFLYSLALRQLRDLFLHFLTQYFVIFICIRSNLFRFCLNIFLLFDRSVLIITFLRLSYGLKFALVGGTSN